MEVWGGGVQRSEIEGGEGLISEAVFGLESDALTCEPIPSDDRLDREVKSHGGSSEVVATAPQGVVSGRLRAEARGKFLFSGATKLRVCGVTYGTFRPDRLGSEFNPVAAERDFRDIAVNGVNAVRTYTMPPPWFLDLAAEHGLFVMVVIPWEQHITFLDDRARRHSIEQVVRGAARACTGHQAVLCYAVGNEIPSSI